MENYKDTHLFCFVDVITYNNKLLWAITLLILYLVVNELLLYSVLKKSLCERPSEQNKMRH